MKKQKNICKYIVDDIFRQYFYVYYGVKKAGITQW